jgi:hypothetical protein
VPAPPATGDLVSKSIRESSLSSAAKVSMVKISNILPSFSLSLSLSFKYDYIFIIFS